MLISIIICVFLVFGIIIYFYLNKLIDDYVQTANQNDIESIGVSAKSFIGLHIHSLPLDAKLIYVRKTTPYKGVLVFLPDWKFDYHFYLPWLVHICRSGYIIVTYHSKKAVYSQMSSELSDILEMIKKDEVLKTYPLSLVMHGRSSIAGLSLIQKLDTNVKLVCIGAPYLEENVLFSTIQSKFTHKIDYLKKLIVGIFHKKYPANTKILVDQHEIMMIAGKNDPYMAEAASLLSTSESHVDIQIIEDKKDFPFLSINSEQQISLMIQQLKDPSISQFEYNKILENFNLELLYDIDKDVTQNLIQFLEK